MVAEETCVKATPRCQELCRYDFLTMWEELSTQLCPFLTSYKVKTKHWVPTSQRSILSNKFNLVMSKGFPGGSDDRESACNAGDTGSIPGSGRSPGKGNGNPLRYSCLENPMDGGTSLGYSPWGHKESDTTKQLHSLTSLRLFLVIFYLDNTGMNLF